ncbi:MAG: hypothetical protein IKD20_02515 [Clostridia bacterium]|nr:hypothetical protein [Clostridia bacterium]
MKKKLIALALSCAMLLGLGSSVAFAAEESAVKYIDSDYAQTAYEINLTADKNSDHVAFENQGDVSCYINAGSVDFQFKADGLTYNEDDTYLDNWVEFDVKTSAPKIAVSLSYIKEDESAQNCSKNITVKESTVYDENYVSIQDGSNEGWFHVAIPFSDLESAGGAIKAQRIALMSNVVIRIALGGESGAIYETWIDNLDINYKEYKPSTCEDDGHKLIYSTFNKKVVYKEILPAAHVYTVAERIDSTCDVDGSITYTCDVCADTQTAAIKANGHNYTDWSVTREATKDMPGKRQRICIDCGDVEVEEVKYGLGDAITDGANTAKDSATATWNKILSIFDDDEANDEALDGNDTLVLIISALVLFLLVKLIIAIVKGIKRLFVGRRR